MTDDLLQETARTFKYFRAQARRAWNAGRYRKVVGLADAWDKWMSQNPEAPYPDDWRDIERLREDAVMMLTREER